MRARLQLPRAPRCIHLRGLTHACMQEPGPGWHGRSGVHTHMTNTRITDPEILERRYPVVLREFSLRPGSGGAGRWRGGDGVSARGPALIGISAGSVPSALPRISEPVSGRPAVLCELNAHCGAHAADRDAQAADGEHLVGAPGGAPAGAGGRQGMRSGASTCCCAATGAP